MNTKAIAKQFSTDNELFHLINNYSIDNLEDAKDLQYIFEVVQSGDLIEINKLKKTLRESEQNLPTSHHKQITFHDVNEMIDWLNRGLDKLANKSRAGGQKKAELNDVDNDIMILMRNQ